MKTCARTIFQTAEPICDVTLADVEDAISATPRLAGRDRRDYFAARGIDYERVCEYYEIVRNLESALSPMHIVRQRINETRVFIHNIQIVCAMMFFIMAQNDVQKRSTPYK